MSAFNPARAELLETFALDAAMVRGAGTRLFDGEGREYLDVLAQYGALPFGHNPPEIWDALNAAQRSQMPSMVQPLRPLEAERLARRLAEITPGDLAISTFANSGAETVEAAVKLARVRTGRDVILSTWNGFHGKTLGALSATGKPLYQKDFAAPAPGFEYVPFGDLAALEARLEAGADEIAAFIVEPIQGEGGVVVPSEDYIDGVISLCRKYGVLSILDEIQTGLGRTGALFACSGGSEVPDMLLLAKALGGGMMPIGACIVRPSAWDDRFGRLHSSTFANNNLACTVACATLDKLLEDDEALIRDVAANGAYFRSQLEQLQGLYPDVIKQVRGRGYMVGLEFHRFDARDDSATMAFSSLNGGVTALISSYLLNVQGILTAPLFNETHVMRLQPALIAGRAELDRVVAALSATCEAIHRRDYHQIVRHLVDPGRRATATAAAPASTDGPERRPRAADPLDPNRFGFLIHYTEQDEIARLDKSFGKFDGRELADWRNWMKRHGPGLVRRVPAMRSKSGATMDGWILTLPMLPAEMRGPGRGEAVALIKEAVRLAGEQGASRMGLGAFTSVVTRGGESVTGQGLSITSGNTLTSVIAVRALQNVAKRAGVDLANANAVVVGATGAIGRLSSLMLARQVGRLTLVGNPANPFSPRLVRQVGNEVYQTLATSRSASPGELSSLVRAAAWSSEITASDIMKLAATPGGVIDHFERTLDRMGEDPLVTCTNDLERALDTADIVLVATSSEVTLVDPARLRPGTIVCDVARPPNVSRADLSDSGVLVFDGGLVQPPEPIDLGPVQTLPTGMCWGCLGETMLLAFEGESGDFSIGTKLSLRDADRIAQLADKHGFEPAAPQWYGTHLTQADFDDFARRFRSGAFFKRRWMRTDRSDPDLARAV